MGRGTLSAGVATLTADMLPGGKDTITAVYSGGNNYFGLGNNYLGSRSNAVTELAADFTLTESAPAGLILWPGQSTTFTFTLTATNGDYNEKVNFAIAGLPPNVTATFNPQAVTLGSNPVTVTVTFYVLQNRTLLDSSVSCAPTESISYLAILRFEIARRLHVGRTSVGTSG